MQLENRQIHSTVFPLKCWCSPLFLWSGPNCQSVLCLNPTLAKASVTTAMFCPASLSAPYLSLPIEARLLFRFGKRSSRVIILSPLLSNQNWSSSLTDLSQQSLSLCAILLRGLFFLIYGQHTSPNVSFVSHSLFPATVLVCILCKVDDHYFHFTGEEMEGYTRTCSCHKANEIQYWNSTQNFSLQLAVSVQYEVEVGKGENSRLKI